MPKRQRRIYWTKDFEDVAARQEEKKKTTEDVVKGGMLRVGARNRVR